MFRHMPTGYRRQRFARRGYASAVLSSRPPLSLGVLAGATLTTLVVYPLKSVAADISLSVVYLVAALFIASFWGVWLGIATSVASALAFNFFHIAPTGQFSISDGENWVALAVFLIASVVASALADAARSRALEADQRRREADLAAEMSRTFVDVRLIAERSASG